MNSQNNETPQNPWITGETVLAIITVALAALWIAFAYYKGSGTDSDEQRIMLLHPLVPIALIILLIRIHRWVGIKFVLYLEITMISLWLVSRLLGVFMPFILGFGFAYLFRFLWKALPFKKKYQRTLATILIILICSGMLVFACIGVGFQLGQMTKGLQKFYHEALLPAVFGEEFRAMAVDVSGGTETFFLATNNGIYFLQVDRDNTNIRDDKPKKVGITNGDLVGKDDIQAIAVNQKYIFAATQYAVYRCSKSIVEAATGKTKDSLIAPTEELIWTKIDTPLLGTLSIQTINAPKWDSKLVYVGTNRGLYKSEEAGENLTNVEIDNLKNRSITSITSIETFADVDEKGENKIPRKTRILYVACTTENTNQDLQQNNTNTELNSQIPTDTDKEGQDYTSVEAENGVTSEITKSTLAISNDVYWRQPDSPKHWDSLGTETKEGVVIPKIQILVATDKKDKDIVLYAGTANGLYDRTDIRMATWGNMTQDSNRLPESISFLVSTPSGLYAGNKDIIHHNNNSSTWNAFIEKKAGVLIYRDEPIVKEFQEYLTEKIPGWSTSSGAVIKWVSGLAGSIAFQFSGFIATFFLASIVFAYASQGLDHYFDNLISIVPDKHQDTIKAYLQEIDKNMHQFLKGQFTVILIVSIISCIIYRIVGVPFALLIGILAGLCNAIPTFGPFIGGGFALVAMMMGLAAGEFTGILDFLIRCLFVLGAILGIQTIDNTFISPKVMSNAIDVDPLLIMFSVIVGASILGLWGVLLAIPTIVVIKSIVSVSKSTINETEA